MELKLTPPVDLRVRLLVLAVLLIPVMLAPRLTMFWRVAACFMPLMLAGTYRVTRIHGWKRACTWVLPRYVVTVASWRES